MNDCVFCKIIKGEINADKVYEDENCIIIKDINPKAKIHLLLIPKSHYALLEEASVSESMEIAFMLNKLASIKDSLGLKDGYRIVLNQGKNSGQEVAHLHFHILGGEKLGDII